MRTSYFYFQLFLGLLAYVHGRSSNHDPVSCPDFQITGKNSQAVQLEWTPKADNGHNRECVVFMSGIEKVWKDVGHFFITLAYISELEEDAYYAFRVLCVDISSPEVKVISYARPDLCQKTVDTRTEPAEERSHWLKSVVKILVISGVAVTLCRMFC